MKDAVKLFSVVSTLIASLTVYLIISSLNSSPAMLNRVPGDTVIRDISEAEEKAESQLKREWIEHMHQAAPGVDWESVEFANRWEKYRHKLAGIRYPDWGMDRKRQP